MIEITLSEEARSISSLLPYLKVRFLVSWNIRTEIVTEGFRDKIFDAKIVAALVRALLGDRYSIDGKGVGEIFTAAIAQGAPRCFHGIFMLK